MTPKTPREAGEAAFYADEGNTPSCLKAAFDAYEAATKPARDDLVRAVLAAQQSLIDAFIEAKWEAPGETLVLINAALSKAATLSKTKEG